MPKVTINNFIGGLSITERQGAEGSYAVGTAIDPWAVQGYLQPGATPTNEERSDDGTVLLNNPINAFEMDATNGVVYGIENNARTTAASRLLN